jgi:2-oxoglutarate dehydrogenase E2 component (dihydrolipoamide succinyltransferase)
VIRVLTEERKKKIIEMLDKDSVVQIQNLSEIFNVSIYTIRRDLSDLEKKGLLKKTHGGAVKIEKVMWLPSIEQGKKEAAAEKPVEPVKEASPSMHDNFSNAPMEKEEVREDLGFLSPLVLNIARQENIPMEELKRVKGTGLEGRITKKDLLSYLEQRKDKPVQQKQVKETSPIKKEEPKEERKAAPVPGFIPDYSKLQVSGEVERIPMDNIRQKIMQHMIASRDTSVHVSAMLEVDMSRIHNFMQKNKDEFQKQHGVKLTYMPFVAEASVKALRQFPLVNSTIEGTTILQKKFINLGIAVAIEPADNTKTQARRSKPVFLNLLIIPSPFPSIS